MIGQDIHLVYRCINSTIIIILYILAAISRVLNIWEAIYSLRFIDHLFYYFIITIYPTIDNQQLEFKILNPSFDHQQQLLPGEGGGEEENDNNNNSNNKQNNNKSQERRIDIPTTNSSSSHRESSTNTSSAESESEEDTRSESSKKKT